MRNRNPGALRGANQLTVRNNNERLVLQMIRREGRLTKVEATRKTGLSPNAVSVIFNALEDEGLLLRCEPIRGRIGQPSVPRRLNPDARFYCGVKIGRRSFEMILVDFCGNVRALKASQHLYPTPDAAVEFASRSYRALLKQAKVSEQDVSGCGIAMPYRLWEWTDDFAAPRTEMQAWRDFDPEVFAGILPAPIFVENDGTAACRAEWVFGKGPELKDAVYFFVGFFIGGGVILDGAIFRGFRGNAGGFGPMRIPDEPGGARLFDHASLIVLEKMLNEQGIDCEDLFTTTTDWSHFEPTLSAWISRAARSMAQALISAAAVIDFEDVVVDGFIPEEVRSRLVDEIKTALLALDLQGIYPPAIRAGSHGNVARALGAASIHISTKYMMDNTFHHG